MKDLFFLFRLYCLRLALPLFFSILFLSPISVYAMGISNYSRTPNTLTSPDNTFTVSFDVSGSDSFIGIDVDTTSLQGSGSYPFFSSCGDAVHYDAGTFDNIHSDVCVKPYSGGHYNFTFTLSSNNYTNDLVTRLSSFSGDYSTYWGSLTDGADLESCGLSNCFEWIALITNCPDDVPSLSIAGDGYNAFSNTTGISMNGVTCWTGDNLTKPFIGAGFSTLYTLRYWIVALIMLGAIVYFTFRAMGFFKR